MMAKDKKATMTEIREWYEKRWSGLNEKLDIEDSEDVCNIIWVWEKHKWTKNTFRTMKYFRYKKPVEYSDNVIDAGAWNDVPCFKEITWCEYLFKRIRRFIKTL